MLLDKLKKELNNGGLENALDTIEKIGLMQDYTTVPTLINYLVSTNNNMLRDALAIALADIGDHQAIEPLIGLLKSPKTLKSRGTLLYALESFNCSNYAELITELLFENNFEVSRQAFILLEAQMLHISNDVKTECIKRIKQELRKTPDKVQFLTESIDLFLDN
ncbi:HEAT repeat domain-containing protein [Priestia aryabhattai]|uniref:HEAT repeat domain-containing protein n=1 Tax=Priestia aryabhattai TaxID=412384 RepID=A0AAX6N307_PRIAR|nr:HEAT repeat domain-containing protein [Priestia aryabhattai]MDU9690179.1 HEAT repeat domain-containing protein [Priestia aryabhattai]